VFRLQRAVRMLREVLHEVRGEGIYEFEVQFNLECGRCGHINKANIPKFGKEN
jgi:hypothetical protein